MASTGITPPLSSFFPNSKNTNQCRNYTDSLEEQEDLFHDETTEMGRSTQSEDSLAEFEPSLSVAMEGLPFSQSTSLATPRNEKTKYFNLRQSWKCIMVSLFLIIFCIGLGIGLSMISNNNKNIKSPDSTTNIASPTSSNSPKTEYEQQIELIKEEEKVEEDLLAIEIKEEEKEAEIKEQVQQSTNLETLRDGLLPISGHALLYDTSTYQYKALQFVADNMDTIDTELLEETYILALLYYSMNGEHWRDPDIFMNISKSVCEWNVGDNTGVYCDSTATTSIDRIKLESFNISGTIIPELRYLSSLQTLMLRDNDIVGAIPTEFGMFPEMFYFDLSSNQLTGTLPTEIGRIGSRLPRHIHTYFSMFDNQLQGTIPTEIGRLDAKVLRLNHNSFVGTVPYEISNIKDLIDLNLSDNQLTGPIPTEFGNLLGLRFLRLNANQLSGEIPSELGNLAPSRFNILRLDNNNLQNYLPEEIGNLRSLTLVNIYNNNITGSLNPIFCDETPDGDYHSNNISQVFRHLELIKADILCKDLNISIGKVTCACCCCNCNMAE